ncbi:MAG TPA: DUF1844 domain-containing protein [Actinocrinis sp.]|jgi:hypothetical protein|nr:DUF1844 domain-containing protein [Actinocrinis sp.]
MSDSAPHTAPGLPGPRDLADVPAVEVIATLAVHLMTAAAVQLGLGEPDAPESNTPAAHEPPAPVDLDEARKLITALAGLVTAAAPEIGSQHAAPLRDGLRTLQLAFREASVVPDPPGAAPGEKLTGPVLP